MTENIYLKIGKRRAVRITVKNQQEKYAVKILNRNMERFIKAQETYNRRCVSFETAYDDGHSYEPMDKDTPTPEIQCVERECQEELKKRIVLALGKLTERQRLIVHKYFWEEKSQVEIAKELGINKSSVNITLTRAMDNLKNFLEEN